MENNKKVQRIVLLLIFTMPLTSPVIGDPVEFSYPSDPGPWVVVILLAILLFVVLGILFFVARYLR
ncbi:hypothetical protein HYY75_06055 [bacterium]|nr:hypothetical protein [bacterium]